MNGGWQSCCKSFLEIWIESTSPFMYSLSSICLGRVSGEFHWKGMIWILLPHKHVKPRANTQETQCSWWSNQADEKTNVFLLECPTFQLVFLDQPRPKTLLLTWKSEETCIIFISNEYLIIDHIPCSPVLWTHSVGASSEWCTWLRSSVQSTFHS